MRGYNLLIPPTRAFLTFRGNVTETQELQIVEKTEDILRVQHPAIPLSAAGGILVLSPVKGLSGKDFQAIVGISLDSPPPAPWWRQLLEALSA